MWDSKSFPLPPFHPLTWPCPPVEDEESCIRAFVVAPRLPVAIALLAAVASCKPRADQTASARVLRVTTSDFAFDAPSEIGAGLVTIQAVNHGPSLHEVAREETLVCAHVP